MEIQVNHRDNFSRVQLKEPKQNAFTENTSDTEETEISDKKMPIKDLYKKWSPFIYFIMWMLTMAVIASYGYGNKYEKLMTAIERRWELIWQMEYNNKAILWEVERHNKEDERHNKFMQEKISDNVKIRNQILSDNEMMVEAIKTANGVKEQKIVEN